MPRGRAKGSTINPTSEHGHVTHVRLTGEGAKGGKVTSKNPSPYHSIREVKESLPNRGHDYVVRRSPRYAVVTKMSPKQIANTRRIEDHIEDWKDAHGINRKMTQSEAREAFRALRK